jgi:hypothetical protein
MHLQKRWRTVAAIAAVISAGACSGNGCSCVTPIKGGFPTAQRHEGAIQVRATQTLFDYLSANGPTILPNLIPGGATFNVPPQCNAPLGTKICCATPAPMCRISITFNKLTLTPTAPNVIKLNTDVIVKTLDNLPADVIGGTCMISIDTTRTGAQTMNITSDIQFTVDATTDLTSVTLANTSVTGLDSGDVNDSETGSTPLLCDGLNFLNGLIVSLLESQLQDQLSSTVQSQLCMKCSTLADCNSFATACTSGQCIGSDGMTCVQEIGLEGRMNAGSALASFSPGLQAYLDILIAAGGFAKADSGLSLGMLGGGLSDPHSPCVPTLPPPPTMTIPSSTTFDTDVLPDNATPYHLGIGVHVSHLDTLGFAAWDSGALCLDVGTPSVALLSSKTVGVIISSLSDLTHGDDVPMFLVFRPAEPPTFTMGKGTFKTDPQTGARSVDDPLLHIAVPKFGIDFYAFIDERYVRIMTLTSDLDLGVSLDVDAQGKLVPLLGDVKNAFKHLVISNSALLAESPEDLAAAFPTLLGIAVGQLTGSLSSISLPAVMGLNLHPLAITSTDPGPDGNNQFLSIFANVSAATTDALSVETTARMESLVLPTTAEFAVGKRTGVVPTLEVGLGGRPVAGAPLEWSWSLDGGPWSPFSTAERLTITDPLLWLQGRHHVDARARGVGLPETLDPTPARVDFIVDTIAPVATLQDGPAGTIQIVASDNVSPSDALEYRYGLPGGALSEWTRQAWFDLPADVDHDVVIVQVLDEAGNLGTADFHGRTTNPPTAGCGCELGAAPSASSRAGSLAALAIVFALGLALAFARRARRAFALLAALALLQACNSGLGKGDFESPLDEIGRFSDVAVKDGAFFVSAYDDTMGDLAFARITDPTRQISWQFVDGIDPTAMADKPGDYRSGVSDPGPDVGLYTSIALTRSGDPRIAYFDRSNGALKYASGPGHFANHTVQASPDGTVEVGLYAALTLDANDIPSIAYMATGFADPGGTFHSELRLAVAKNASPQAAADWTISTVDSTRLACAGRCPMGQFCIQAAMVNMMPNGDPSISTCTAPDAAPCAASCASTEACVMGACTAFLPTPKPDLTPGTGLFTQALRSPTGALQLIYYDYPQHSLKLAAQSAPGGQFAVSFVDGNDPSTDVGQFATAALADDGTVHVAYVDAIADRLLYKTITGGNPSMTPEVIDDGMRPDGPHSVGAGAALILDGGSPRVVYQDQTLSSTEQARRAGTWTHTDLMTGFAGYGWWPRLVSDGAKIWLSQFVYDRENGSPAPLGNLQITALP